MVIERALDAVRVHDGGLHTMVVLLPGCGKTAGPDTGPTVHLHIPQGREGRKEMKGMLGVKSHVNSTEYSDVAQKASSLHRLRGVSKRFYRECLCLRLWPDSSTSIFRFLFWSQDKAGGKTLER